MKLLAFDTSSAACSVGLSIDGKITSHHEIAPMQQAKTILPIIDNLLKSQNIGLNQLDAIAFGCGPGSFTGVRIAVSVAQGLAYAAQKPLVSVSSLAATAQAAYQEFGLTQLVVASDARMQEVYWAPYEVQENKLVKLMGKEQISPPEDIILPSLAWGGVGNAWGVYEARISAKPAHINTQCLPTAEGILLLAEALYCQGHIVSPADAIPVYLREEVAKKSNVV